MSRSRASARLALLVSAVLAVTTIASPAAAEPAEDPCFTGSGDFSVDGPGAVYGIVGVPLAAAPFTAHTEQPATWAACRDLPAGLSFDSGTASLVGTPMAPVETLAAIVATDPSGSVPLELAVRVLPASVLDVAVTDDEGAPIDSTNLQRGSTFQLRGAGLPDSSTVRALLGSEQLGDPVSIETSDGDYIIAGEIPKDAASGTHPITIEFTMPGGAQRYTTQVSTTVKVLTISGPPALTPVAGASASYTFPVSGASGAVRYSLSGALPTGLRFDPARGTITGTPATTAPKRALQITATDARGSVTHEASLAVLSATVTTPSIAPIMSPQIGAFQRFGEHLDAGAGPEEALERATRQHDPQTPGQGLMIGTDPETGRPVFFSAPPSDPRVPASRSERITVGTPNEAERAAMAAARTAALLKEIEAERARQQAANEAASERARQKAAERAGLDAERARDREAQARAQEDLRKAQQAEADAKRRERQAALDQQRAEQLAALAEQRRAQLAGMPEANPLPEGTQVRVELHSTPVLLGSTTVGASGGFAIEVSAPATVTPGQHHLVVTYTLPDGTVHVSRTAVTAVAPDAIVTDAGPAATLPVMGGGASAGGALAALLLGLGLLLMVRRREARASAD